MDDAVLDQLRTALVTHRPRVHQEPQLTEALLRDLCGSNTHRREISALAAAVKGGVPETLLAAKQAGLYPRLGDQLARKLWENLALDHDAARWAVRIWASALDITGIRFSAPGSGKWQPAGAGSPDRPGSGEARRHIARLAIRALEIARSLPEQKSKAVALGLAATALAVTDPGQAKRLLDEAETLVESVNSENNRTCQQHGLSVAVASSYPVRAERLASSVQGPMKDHALGCLASVLARHPRQDLDEALRVARMIGHESLRMSALDGLAAAMADTAPVRAAQLAESLTGEYWQTEALCHVATVLAAENSGHAAALLDDAERLARLVEDEAARAAALSSVGRAVAASDPARAAAFFDEAEHMARSAVNEPTREPALGSLAIALAASDPDRALSIARSLTEGWYALGEIAKILADVDPPDRALSIAQSLPSEPQLADVAVAMTAADTDKALLLARSISTDRWQASALVGIARALTATEPDRAAKLLARVESYAEEKMTGDLDKVITLVQVAAAWGPDG